MPTITIPELKKEIAVPPGTRLLDVLIRGGVYPDAVCGGNGSCGKCRVLAESPEPFVLREGVCAPRPGAPGQDGFLLAFDIGTTSVVCFLLEGSSGRELASLGTFPRTFAEAMRFREEKV